FGASADAVGATNQINGAVTVSGLSVRSGSFTVDMTSVSSDRTQRDGHFHGRIMNTAQYPTATFKLTSPVTLSTVALNTPVTATATGDLTLHGVTKRASFTVNAQRVS